MAWCLFKHRNNLTFNFTVIPKKLNFTTFFKDKIILFMVKKD